MFSEGIKGVLSILGCTKTIVVKGGRLTMVFALFGSIGGAIAWLIFIILIFTNPEIVLDIFNLALSP
jgi:hypothetical protein